MEINDIVDRLAAVDHELGELEARRALAQKAANLAEVNKLQEDIGRLMQVKDALRERLKHARRPKAEG